MDRTIGKIRGGRLREDCCANDFLRDLPGAFREALTGRQITNVSKRFDGVGEFECLAGQTGKARRRNNKVCTNKEEIERN